MTDLRRGAEEALARWGDGATRSSGRVERLTLDVELGGRTEMVTLSWRDGALRWVSTDGDERSPHVLAALEWLAGRPSPEVRMSMPARPPDGGPGLGSAVAASPGPTVAVADGIDELATAILRAGIRDAKGSPTVVDAIERLRKAGPQPPTTAFLRWLGRLRRAMDAGDENTVVRLLDGACQAAESLRADVTAGPVADRLGAWLVVRPGHREGAPRLTDRVVVEIAREVVLGADAEPIARRYLVCLMTGEVFREESSKHEGPLSVGPCPRTLTVGLGELNVGVTPRTLRVLQYTVSHEVTQHAWLKVQRFARSRLQVVAEEYKRAIRENSALAEPFAVLTGIHVERRQGAVLVDMDGHALPIARAEDPAQAEQFVAVVDQAAPAWVAGRLVDAEGQLMLVPLSVGLLREGMIEHHRLA